jgi:phosphohistidine phosphatase
MVVLLVHHGDALPPEIDPQRPLSPRGLAATAHLAGEARRRGVNPAAIWHSGKLRAKQTAQAFWRKCNPLAEIRAVRGLQPSDPADRMRDELLKESRDLVLAGHFPHLPNLLRSLLGTSGESAIDFPAHGVVALVTEDAGITWREAWRLEEPRDG